jgi:threonine dehydratase
LASDQRPPFGAEAWIKHENQTPVGAFKLRGALVYMPTGSNKREPELKGVVAATRGNHGQGVGMAARLFGLQAVIVVPHGNSKEKNRAMLAQGVPNWSSTATIFRNRWSLPRTLAC